MPLTTEQKEKFSQCLKNSQEGVVKLIDILREFDNNITVKNYNAAIGMLSNAHGTLGYWHDLWPHGGDSIGKKLVDALRNNVGLPELNKLNTTRPIPLKALETLKPGLGRLITGLESLNQCIEREDLETAYQLLGNRKDHDYGSTHGNILLNILDKPPVELIGCVALVGCVGTLERPPFKIAELKVSQVKVDNIQSVKGAETKPSSCSMF
jgi:hypothetical protein